MATNETKCTCSGDGADFTRHAQACATQQPDALTRLEQHLGESGIVGAKMGHIAWHDIAGRIISEARKEMESLQLDLERSRLSDAAHVADLQRSHEMHEGTRELLGHAQDALQRANDTAARLSANSSEALHMGQQQGRVELAQEIVTMLGPDFGRLPGHVEGFLRSIMDEDANQ